MQGNGCLIVAIPAGRVSLAWRLLSGYVGPHAINSLFNDSLQWVTRVVMKQFPLPELPTNRQPRSPAEPKGPSRQPPRWPGWSRRGLIYVVLGVATLALVVVTFRPAPIRVEIGHVERGPLLVTVDAEGKTRIRDRFVISADVNGHLDRIDYSEGDPVQEGDVVARIDPLPLTSSVQEALGRLAEARAQRAGVETQRPKPEALSQARTRIAVADARYRQEEARVAQAQADLDQARRDRQRAQALESAGAISRQERETAELTESNRADQLEAAIRAAQAAASEVNVARDALAVLQAEQRDPDYLLRVYDARIASIEAELSRLQDDASRTEVRSPVSGKVLRVLQKSAQFVAEGTPLLELGNTQNLELVIDVLSTDAETIQPGAPILVTSGATSSLAIEETASLLRARVRRVEPSAFTKVSALGVEEQRVNIIGDFVAPPETLGDGYRVETRIVVWEGQDVLQVPLSALFRCDTGWCVFTVQQGRAQLRQVQVAHRSDVAIEIQKGLTEGDGVILHPSERIEPGKRVTSS